MLKGEERRSTKRRVLKRAWHSESTQVFSLAVSSLLGSQLWSIIVLCFQLTIQVTAPLRHQWRWNALASIEGAGQMDETLRVKNAGNSYSFARCIPGFFVP